MQCNCVVIAAPHNVEHWRVTKTIFLVFHILMVDSCSYVDRVAYAFTNSNTEMLSHGEQLQCHSAIVP